ncbi:hypothetical protein V1478_001682 [Vespula squamosa]|uniref:Uncharacterized protein n=1 Tax=Vespula squamosa TaxID=30214 RepID=A0ABD2BXV0_VESSQ
MNIIALIAFLKVASALIGYDCTGSSLNISTFSLLDVADCETPDLQPVNSTVFIQLLQTSDYNMGPAAKLTSAVPTKGSMLFMVTSKDVIFTLIHTSDFALCGYTLVRMEHPKLFIMETSPDRIFKVGDTSIPNTWEQVEFIMEPIEKPAILDTLARGISGKQISTGKISLYNIMDEDSLDKIAASTGTERLWEAFVTFGSASAGKSEKEKEDEEPSESWITHKNEEETANNIDKPIHTGDYNLKTKRTDQFGSSYTNQKVNFTDNLATSRDTVIRGRLERSHSSKFKALLCDVQFHGTELAPNKMPNEQNN